MGLTTWHEVERLVHAGWLKPWWWFDGSYEPHSEVLAAFEKAKAVFLSLANKGSA